MIHNSSILALRYACGEAYDHKNADEIDGERETVSECFVVTVPPKTNTTLGLGVDA